MLFLFESQLIKNSPPPTPSNQQKHAKNTSKTHHFRLFKMGWLFSKPPEQETQSKTFDQLKNEQDLLQELPNDLVSFYHLKNQQNEFQFPTEKQKRFNEGELASVQCADFQVEYLNCITDGKFTDKFKGCTVKMEKFQNCLKFQKELFYQLGLNYCESEAKLDKVLGTADDLTLKWFGKSDPSKPFSNELMKDVYDEREKIWKPST